jgi:hypothetical protein
LYGGAGAAAVAPDADGVLKGAPQLSQNASPGMADAPHCAHTTPAEAGGGGGTAGYAGSVGALADVATGISVAPH